MIAETTIDFAMSCIDAGSTGICLGIGGDGQILGDLDKKQVEAYALRYDKRILDVVEAPIKLLRVCSAPACNHEKLMEEGWFKNYPVTALNWASRSWTPVKRGKELSTATGFAYGVASIMRDPPHWDAGAGGGHGQEGDRGLCRGRGIFMLGPGCAVYRDMPWANYNAVGRAAWKCGAYRG